MIGHAIFHDDFAFGRRGSTLSTKLVREKTAKGYTPGEDGTPYQHTDNELRSTGLLPQLLNPIDENAVRRLIHDNEHCMQEKFDGKRVPLRKQNKAGEGPLCLGARTGRRVGSLFER